MSEIVSLDAIREHKRYLTPAEAEALLSRKLSQVEETQRFTVEDLEKRMAETYEAPVCLRP